MEKITALALAIAVTFGGACAALKSEAVVNEADKTADIEKTEDDEMKSVDFAGEFFIRAFEENPGRSFVISPLSAYYALSMAASGADGETLKQLENALGGELSEVEQRVAEYTESLTRSLGSTSLSVANSIWTDASFELDEDISEVMERVYSAERFELPSDPAGAVKKINSWVSDKTNRLIPKLLDELPANTSMLLMNALYMNAKWESQFTGNTTAESFRKENGGISSVEMMRRPTEKTRVIQTEDALGVVLPYDDGRLTFAAIMPSDEKAPLSELIGSLSERSICELASTATLRSAYVSLPRFEAEYSFSLNDIMRSMGIIDAFDSSRADFSGFAEDNGFCITEALQKVKLKVNEQGTEGAAVTAIMLMKTSMMMERPISITFDRPFVYAVMDGQTGAVLFMGAYFG